MKQFPDEIKKEIGYHLYQMQKGMILSMPHSKPMPSIASGCYELRISGKDILYRVLYYLKIKDFILVFHAFNKKTQKTSYKDIQIGKKNLKELLHASKK